MGLLEIRLKFSKEFGHSLDYTNKLAEDCDPEYVAWLEKQIEKSEWFQTLTTDETNYYTK